MNPVAEELGICPQHCGADGAADRHKLYATATTKLSLTFRKRRILSRSRGLPDQELQKAPQVGREPSNVVTPGRAARPAVAAHVRGDDPVVPGEGGKVAGEVVAGAAEAVHEDYAAFITGAVVVVVLAAMARRCACCWERRD